MVTSGDPIVQTSYVARRSTLFGVIAVALALTLQACRKVPEIREYALESDASRAQLSIGYSLLYQQADSIPKLKWLLMFKEKHEPMDELTSGLDDYYRRLADTMQRLAKQYPAMRIDELPMAKIEADAQKAMGEDLAKDFAPVVGKAGIDFEREALLMFYDVLNEQRHLTGVMMGLETDPHLKAFLQTTTAQLEARYTKVGDLLNQRYFTH